MVHYICFAPFKSLSITMDRNSCPSIPHIGLFTSKQAYLVDQIFQLSTKSLVDIESTYEEYFKIAEWENQQSSAADGFHEEQLELIELFDYFFLEIDNRPQNDPEDGFIDFKILNSDEEDDMCSGRLALPAAQLDCC